MNALVPCRHLVLLTATVAIVACGLLPGLASAAPPAANPTSLAFGTETAGKTSVAQTVTVSDPGPGPVHIAGVSVIGTDVTDFSISGGSCAGATLEQGETCAVEVAFAPASGGPRSATLEFALELEAPLDVPLSGTGETMKLTVPGTASFPTTTRGSASTVQIPLKNTSEAGVDVNEVTFEGTDAGDFGIEGNNCVGFIGPGMACELTVRFSPGATGPREASLRIATDAVPSVYLTEMSAEGAAPDVTFEPGGHDFGLVEVHSGGPRTNFTVRNTGAASVQLSNLEITGPDTSEFWIPGSNCWGTTLAPGASCFVEVQFNANEDGDFSAAVSVSAGGGAFVAPLAARAERPKVEASPATLVFGPTSVGSREVRELTLTDTGELPVGFYIAIVSGGDVANFHLLEETCTSNVFAGDPRIFEPGESCAAKVAFEPIDAGPKKATVSIFGAGEGALQIPVEGSAVAPRLSLSPSSHDFGAVAVGGAGPVQTFQLHNESGEAQTIDTVTPAGADLGDFGVRSDECSEAVLEPGAACSIAVRFAPESSGPKAATLRLRGPGGTTIAPLSGEGTAVTSVSAMTAEGGRSRGRVTFDLFSQPRRVDGKVTIGRARCESSEACVIKLGGLVSGRISTASGLRAGVRGLAASRLKLAPGATASVTTTLPREFRAAVGPATLRFTLRWRTGSDRGVAGHGFRLVRSSRRVASVL